MLNNHAAERLAVQVDVDERLGVLLRLFNLQLRLQVLELLHVAGALSLSCLHDPVTTRLLLFGSLLRGLFLLLDHGHHLVASLLQVFDYA